MCDKQENEPNSRHEFKKVISDLKRDILTTFPELENNLHEDIKNTDNINNLFEYCKTIYPERFFDILYQNNDIWDNEEVNTCFLPELDFAILMKDNDVSETTKDTLWKYLQLILLSITSSLNTGESFGDTAKLFEAINEDEFKSKLEETVEKLHSMFDDIKNNDESNDESNDEGSDEKINLDDLPDPEELHSHITGMLDGKLGRLAREIAEDTAESLGVDMDGAENVGDVFKNLFKNPGKLMNLVKDVGGKLDEKIKTGEIKESELLQEATDIMAKMKNMPGMQGMDNIQDLLKKMGMPGNKMPNFNQGSFKNEMDKQLKLLNMKERLKNKYTDKKWTDGTTMDKTNLDEAEKLAQATAEQLLAEINEEKCEKSSEGKTDGKKKKKKKRKKAIK